jgi:hypothetical protein
VTPFGGAVLKIDQAYYEKEKKQSSFQDILTPSTRGIWSILTTPKPWRTNFL